MNYQAFLASKEHAANRSGFAPEFMPAFLYDFQQLLVDWAVRKGCAARNVWVYGDHAWNGRTPQRAKPLYAIRQQETTT